MALGSQHYVAISSPELIEVGKINKLESKIECAVLFLDDPEESNVH